MRLSMVDYRLIAFALVGLLGMPWMATRNGVDDQDPITLARARQTAQITGLSFSPDGKTIARSSSSPSLLLRKVVDGKTVRLLTTGPRDAFLVAFSPDGRLLALGGTRPDVWLCDLRPDGTARPLGIPVQQTSSLAFSPDGGILAVASDACNEIFLWDVHKGQLRSTLRGHESTVQNVAFSPDGRSLASGETSNPVILIWDITAARPRRRLDPTVGPVRALAYSPDGAFLASVSGRFPRVQLWDTNSGQERRQFEENFTASHAAFSANGQFLATADYEGTIRVRRVATGELCKSMPTQPAWIDTLAVSSDGRHLAVSGNNGDFCLWNLDKILRNQPEK